MTFLSLRVLPMNLCTRICAKSTQRVYFPSTLNCWTNNRNYHCLNRINDLTLTVARAPSNMRNTQANTQMGKICAIHCIATTLKDSHILLPSTFKVLTISDRGKKTTRKQIQNEQDDSDTDDSDDEKDFQQFDEDEDFPSNYRELKAHMQTLRLDAVVSSGLSISRNQVEKYFLSNVLRINGGKAYKKHTRLDVGDYVDLITEKSEEGTKVKRVRIMGIDDARSSKSGKLTVYLRAWRANVLVKEI